MIFLGSCASSERAYVRGDYRKAIERALRELRKDPSDATAKKNLTESYNYLVDRYEEQIEATKLGTAPRRWEQVVSYYAEINQLYNLVRSTPAAAQIVEDPVRYDGEYQLARRKAAEANFEIGMQKRALGGRENARQALWHFERAQSYSPNFREDILSIIEETRLVATLKVLVEHNALPIALRNRDEYFRNQINSYLMQLNRKGRVEFYLQNLPPAISPDQYLRFEFHDIQIGGIQTRERVETITDTLITESENEGERIINKEVISAELSDFQKTWQANAVIDFKVIDAQTQAIIKQQQVPSEYIWRSEWSRYQGDKRALSAQQLERCQQREQSPPTQQVMFDQLTEEMLNRIKAPLHEFYRQY